MTAPTKLDHTLARKKTERAAAEAPILALLGLTPVYTAQDRADKRAECTASAEVNASERDAKHVREIEAMRVEVLELAGMVALLELEAYLTSSPLLSTSDNGVLWMFWIEARKRGRAGEPLFDAWTPAAARPRSSVDVADVLAVVAASPVPLKNVEIADALPSVPHLLDVVDAAGRLRDAGRIVAVETRNRFRGWTTPERAGAAHG